jgi:hypothetical protein
LDFWILLFLRLESGKLGIWTSGFRKAWILEIWILGFLEKIDFWYANIV